MEKLYLTPPNTKKEDIIGSTVGFRPYRVGGVRLECEKIDKKFIYHNYGHGGAGVSNGYGCAKFIVSKFVNEHGMSQKTVAVIGSGYIGLFTAILLAELGYQVNLYADNFPAKFGVYKDKPIITSQVAGGLWMPYGYDLCNRAMHDITAKDTFEFYQKCIKERRYQGLSYKKVLQMGSAMDLVKLFVPRGLITDSREVEVTFGNGVFYPARTFTSILMDGDNFLNDLMRDAISKGVKIITKKFDKLEDILKLDETIIFNCTGGHSSTLFNDKNIKLIKGQLVYMKKPADFDYFLQTVSPDGARVTTYPQDGKQAIGLSYEENVTDPKPCPVVLETLRKNMEAFFADKIKPKL